MANTIDLSEREIEILKLVATGVSNKEISRELNITTNTVKVHLRNIYSKIGVFSRTEATLFAIENHIVDSPGMIEVPAASPMTFSQKYRYALLGMGIVVTLGIIGILWVISQPRSTPAGLNQATTTPIQRLQDLVPLPDGRIGMASAVYENQIYILSGETSVAISGESLRYDIMSNEWHPISDKPTPVRDSQAILIGEKIYVPGGQSASGITSQLEVYDPRTDRWESKTAMPQPNSAYALATLDGKLYLFGGWTGKEFLDDVFIYDPIGDFWVQGADMPTARADAGIAVAGGKIYVIGGTSVQGDLPVNESYTPNRDRPGDQPWMTQPSLPEGEIAYGAQSIGDVLFVISRNNADRYSILQLLPQNNEWSYLDEIPPPQLGRHFALANHQGYLYLLGGMDDIGVLSDRTVRYQVIYTVYIPVLNQ